MSNIHKFVWYRSSLEKSGGLFQLSSATPPFPLQVFINLYGLVNVYSLIHLHYHNNIHTRHWHQLDWIIQLHYAIFTFKPWGWCWCWSNLRWCWIQNHLPLFLSLTHTHFCSVESIRILYVWIIFADALETTRKSEFTIHYFVCSLLTNQKEVESF